MKFEKICAQKQNVIFMMKIIHIDNHNPKINNTYETNNVCHMNFTETKAQKNKHVIGWKYFNLPYLM